MMNDRNNEGMCHGWNIFPATYVPVQAGLALQGGWGGWPTGNGKKLSSCQTQLGQATCLAVA